MVAANRKIPHLQFDYRSLHRLGRSHRSRVDNGEESGAYAKASATACRGHSSCLETSHEENRGGLTG
jgi:hypothetical protein